MQAASCSVHASREAIGVCIACRHRVCAECATKVDGINYCVDCLARLGDPKDHPGRGRPISSARRRFAAVFWLASSVLLVWGLVELAFPGLQ